MIKIAFACQKCNYSISTELEAGKAVTISCPHCHRQYNVSDAGQHVVNVKPI